MIQGHIVIRKVSAVTGKIPAQSLGSGQTRQMRQSGSGRSKPHDILPPRTAYTQRVAYTRRGEAMFDVNPPPHVQTPADPHVRADHKPMSAQAEEAEQPSVAARGEQRFPYRSYRSLSSVARTLLPIAEKLHSQGMSWRDVAEELKVSNSALYIWRKLRQLATKPCRLDEHADKGELASPNSWRLLALEAET